MAEAGVLFENDGVPIGNDSEKDWTTVANKKRKQEVKWWWNLVNPSIVVTLFLVRVRDLNQWFTCEIRLTSW